MRIFDALRTAGIGDCRLPQATHWVLAALALVCTAAAADYPLEIIELHSRLPEDVIPIVAPLAGADGTVVGSGGALFVRASPERLADIRRALAEIDRPVQGLLIQVRQAATNQGSGAGVDARVDERIGESARIRIGTPGPAGTGIHAWGGEQDSQRDILQQVRALDGHPARISIGTDRPQPYRETFRGPGARITREGTVYDRTQTGFTVLPRVVGDRVSLQIGTRAEEPGPGGTVRGATLGTSVEGRLGEWIPIGASTESAASRGTGFLHAGRGRGESDLQIEIRVLPAP